jgi:hypothetical protein
MKKTTFIITIWTAVVFIGIMVFGGWFLGFTTPGAKVVSNYAFGQYFKYDTFDYDKIDGNLSRGLIFENLELRDFEGLPNDSVLRIQKLFLRLTAFSIKGLVVETENCRLKLPVSDSIILSGQLKNGMLDFNVFSEGVRVEELIKVFAKKIKLTKNVSGTAGNIDLYLKGFYEEPKLTGGLVLEDVSVNGFSLSRVPVQLDLSFKKLSGTDLLGTIRFVQGSITSRKTLVILEESRVTFDGDVRNPVLNFKGHSNIENVKISISVTGFKNKPEIHLNSMPPLPESQLLVMLATGQDWQGVESWLESGTLSPDVAKDFVEYFFFGGQGEPLARKLGLSHLSFRFGGDTKGIKVRKGLNDKLEVGYGVKQKEVDLTQQNISQMIEGEYKINDDNSLAIEVEREQLKDTEFDEKLNAPAKDSIFLKFKKQF